MKITGSGQSTLLLLDVIEVLNKFQIAYAVIGAIAASFYGVVRASLDADAVISLPHGNTDIRNLTAEFEKSRLKTTYRKGDASDPVGAVFVVEDSFKNRVDLLINIKGMPQAVFSRAIGVDFMNAKIRVVAIEDFLAMKIFAGSPKDIQDVNGVLDVSGKKINFGLLKDLTSGYGQTCVKTLNEILKSR